jgi:hypothetical protein
MSNNYEQTEKVLQDMGLTLSVETTDPGGLDKEAKFRCTLARNGASYSFDYTSGWGNRQWTPSGRIASFCARNYFWRPGGQSEKLFGRIRQGQRVSLFNVFRYRFSDEIKEQFGQYTEPIPPTLGDVVYCLLSDSNCVRHGQSFDDFCDDMGGNNDSIKEKATFDAVRESWSGLVRLRLDLDKLDEIMQDF